MIGRQTPVIAGSNSLHETIPPGGDRSKQRLRITTGTPKPAANAERMQLGNLPPATPASDIQSGCGTIANTFMLRDSEKSVMRAPLRCGWAAGSTDGPTGHHSNLTAGRSQIGGRQPDARA